MKASAFSPSFDESAFRTAVVETMKMGMPEDPNQRLTWVWREHREYVPDDPAGNPYDWSTPPVSEMPGNPDLPITGTDQTLQVPYALEFASRPAGSSATVFGEIDESRAVVTLLDKDYAKVESADYCRIGDSEYRIQFDAPPQGLFGVMVWTVYLEAQDES